VPAVRAIRDIADRLRRELAAWPGVRIDDKGSAVALHTRDAASGVRVLAEDRLLRLTAAHPAATELALLEGDGVLELLPAARRAKRDALRWIRDREEDVRGSCFTIFIGDGTTGEDVFRAVGPHGLTIAASDRAAGADFHLPGPAGVAYLLVLMASASPGEFPAIP
jgi:trehalose 6-phosphate phosphatase